MNPCAHNNRPTFRQFRSWIAIVSALLFVVPMTLVGSADAAASATVVVNGGLTPKTLTVEIGTTVTWTLSDGGKVSLESGWGWEVARELLRKGHTLVWNNGDYGGYQAIRVERKTHTYFGASESRKNGQAAGY